MNWMIARGYAKHTLADCHGCGAEARLHAPDMCPWEALPLEYQAQYEQVGTGDLGAAAIITERCLVGAAPTTYRPLAIFSVQGEALTSLLSPGRHCYEVMESPVPIGAAVRAVEYDSIHNILRVTIEGPGLPVTYRGGSAVELDETLITSPLCTDCECCHE